MAEKIMELSARCKGGLALNHFKDVCVPEEIGKTVGSDVWSDPSKLLTAVGLGENFVKDAPFKYLKTNAYIWEYSLLHLCMQLYPKKIVVQKDQYNPLLEKNKHKASSERFIGHGPGNVTRWKNLYKWDLPKDNVGEEIRELGENVKPFCEYLLKRGIGIRDYGETKKDAEDYLKLRKDAATAFCEFLIAKKGKIDAILSFEKNDYDAALYGLLLNGKKGTFSRHVLAVSLLYCLYGRLRDRKDEKELTCKLINKLVACLNKEWPKKTDIQNDIIVYLKRSKKTGFPSLSNYYDFRQHMNVFKRINIWLNFLAETYNIRCEDIKNVERKIIPCYV